VCGYIAFYPFSGGKIADTAGKCQIYSGGIRRVFATEGIGRYSYENSTPGSTSRRMDLGNPLKMVGESS
jgi:hypothetical protein